MAMKAKLLKKLVCLAVMITILHAEFKSDQTIPLDPNAYDAEFSEDLRFLVLLTPSEANVHYTDSGKLLTSFVTDSETATMALASEESGRQMLALGEKSGRITVFNP